MVMMSLSAQCSTVLQIGDAIFKSDPTHNACPVRQVQEGVLGGWACSCSCHKGHECTEPNIIFDKRNDNTWMPPKPEKRPRCLTCKWQGSWEDASQDRELEGT